MEDSDNSPASPYTNGRITVAVPKNNLLALPVPHPTRPPGGGNTGREDCWSEAATEVLIEAWGERYVELSRGNLKQKHWREVADIVNSSGRDSRAKAPKTDIQCKNRIDTVKKKYKIEKLRVSDAANGSTTWPFFNKLDRLIGSGGSGSGSIVKATSSSHHKKKKPLNSIIPIGVPIGFRSAINYHNNKLQQNKQPPRRREDSGSPYSDPDSSPGSRDSFPPERKRHRSERSIPEKKRKGIAWENSVKELTQAVLKFSEAYEEAETSKVRQVAEMEKQRMKFAKEMELQRMQLFMNTQAEMSRLKKPIHGRRGNNHTNNNNSSSS